MLIVYGPPDAGHENRVRAKRSCPLSDIGLMLAILNGNTLIKTMMASHCTEAEKKQECARVRALLAPGVVDMTLNCRVAWNELLTNGTEGQIDRAIRQIYNMCLGDGRPQRNVHTPDYTIIQKLLVIHKLMLGLQLPQYAPWGILRIQQEVLSTWQKLAGWFNASGGGFVNVHLSSETSTNYCDAKVLVPLHVSRKQLNRELGCEEFGNCSAKTLSEAVTASKQELKFDDRVQFHQIDPGNGGSYTAGLLESYMLQELNKNPLPLVTVAHAGDAIENAGRTSNYELRGMLKNKQRGALRAKIVIAYILKIMARVSGFLTTNTQSTFPNSMSRQMIVESLVFIVGINSI